METIALITFISAICMILFFDNIRKKIPIDSLGLLTILVVLLVIFLSCLLFGYFWKLPL